ncbi:MAG TPA: PhzF family phenazine biosynthesis isomerase [Propionibacteriaceae bacterium]|nr:PhzF family phenazine biosynthesis isomerase [Propionibacteriaceae bacterium]
MTVEVLRYAAFTRDGKGGNPAGVVLDAACLADAQMLAVAQAIGYSETAFLLRPEAGEERINIRYFSPRAEVAFCGHATIATAVAHAERHGTGTLHLVTQAGPVAVETQRTAGGIIATLTSPPATVRPVAPAVLERALAALRWSARDLDPDYPSRVASAGNDHLVVGVASAAVLDCFDYDYDLLGRLMADQGWTTVHAFWPDTDGRFHARNAFPPGGVVEDPATGAAAAAFGGYLRDLGQLPSGRTVTVLQGHHMGAPSELLVSPASDGRRLRVSGAANPLALSAYDQGYS